MKFIREHITLQLFWFLMALHILNLSVDAPDPQPEYVREDLTINDMESIIEILLEEVFDIQDALPEYDDDDSGGSVLGGVNFPIVHFQQLSGMGFMFSKDISRLHEYLNYDETYSQQFHPEVVPPPPRV